MPEDLSQMFNLRKTTAPPPPPRRHVTEPVMDSAGGVDRTVDFDEQTHQDHSGESAPSPSAERAEGNTEATARKPVQLRSTKKASPPASRVVNLQEPPEDRPATTGQATPAAVGEGTGRPVTTGGGRASIMLYTTPTVRERMKEEALRTSLSYGQLTLHCIESTIDALEQVFAARVGVTSQLFSTDYRPRNRKGETRSANLNLHITRRDLDVVESLWQRFPGCRSRNDLISTACALHLTGEADS